ncbi:LOW QUALITY PROTEIN: hypothetical protein Cgig2_029788 [Carnegiea gigantea]|uniref:Uncharacterized protein n=1 Tax=Carnegiea gigantea TaxID=171969 RepID=A0A9Q1KLI6_9CARY|nr:LOW QUALITY PROTEIN: hypothetical protein Cgig2_029788 [Carnegiea gigantea]
MASTPYTIHSRHTTWSKSKPQSSKGKPREGGILLSVGRTGNVLAVHPQEACMRPGLEVMDSRFNADPRSILIEVKEHSMLKRLQPMTAAPKPHNAWKYCKFHKQNGHTAAEVELPDKGQIDIFLKREPRFLRKERELACLEPRKEECSIEIVATIAGGYVKGITRSSWKGVR